MNKLITPDNIITLQETAILDWQQEKFVPTSTSFLDTVKENHWFNFTLWNAEDRARRDDMGAHFVKVAKREIDVCNQKRNNAMEAMDAWLAETLKPAPPTACPVHSETPGMIIDRLSILALKCYHMHQQTLRSEVSDNHRKDCLNKYQILRLQQSQLKRCLTTLLEEIQSQTRTFILYHQFKMYNDPTLNPALYDTNDSQ